MSILSKGRWLTVASINGSHPVSCVRQGLGCSVSQLLGSSLFRGNHRRPQFLHRMQPRGSLTPLSVAWVAEAFKPQWWSSPAVEKKVTWFRINTQERALDRLFRSYICIIALTQGHSTLSDIHPVTLPTRAHCVPCPGLFVASSIGWSVFPFPLFSLSSHSLKTLYVFTDTYLFRKLVPKLNSMVIGAPFPTGNILAF